MPEILYKIGDSNEYGDGDVLAVKPDGYVLTWQQINTWLTTGDAPAEIMSLWPDYLIRRFNRRFRRMQYIRTQSNADCIATLLLKNGKTLLDLSLKELEEKSKQIDDERALGEIDLSKMQQYGIDTSWGWEDLKKHGVLKVDSMDEHDRDAILEPDRSDDEKGTYLGRKRCHKIDYKNLLSASEISDLEDQTKYVPVDRSKSKTIKQSIVSKYGKVKSA